MVGQYELESTISIAGVLILPGTALWHFIAIIRPRRKRTNFWP